MKIMKIKKYGFIIAKCTKTWTSKICFQSPLKISNHIYKWFYHVLGLKLCCLQNKRYMHEKAA